MTSYDTPLLPKTTSIPSLHSSPPWFKVVFSPLLFLADAILAPANHGLIKCTIAYFIASLAVFIPSISNFIGHGDGKHFVATCTVYFHPSRSIGAMLQTIIWAVCALLWAVSLSTSSMATAIAMNSIEQRAAGHAIVLIVYVAGGIGAIGWWKHTMSDPTVGVAASMASMVVFFNVTREGSLQLGHFNLRKILQYFFVVLLGLLISSLVNLMIWPVSAKRNLKREVTEKTDQYAHLLGLITRKFLESEKDETLEDELKSGFAQHQAVFDSMKKSLNESRLEYYFMGRKDEYSIMTKVVEAMQNLAHHLSGLRSCCDAQNLDTPGNVGDLSSEAQNTDDLVSDNIKHTFVHHLGPAMKSLAYTTKQALQAIEFGKEKIHLELHLFSNLDRATAIYNEARDEALRDVYSHPIFKGVRGTGQLADREEIAAAMDYFSHTLQDFVMATRQLMCQLKELEEYLYHPAPRSWSFLLHHPKKSVEPTVFDDKYKHNTSPASTIQQKVKYGIWLFVRRMRQPDILFAIKVGVGAAIFAVPAMVDTLRPFFEEYRLEWGLLSYFIVLNASVGGTYSAAFWRITGSALGTALAILTWSIAPGNAFILAPLGAAIATPCMYMIINPKKANAQFGRFILLSYNLTALYAYSISQGVLDDDDDEGGLRPIIGLIAYHRIISVTAGCLWGALLNTYIWPLKARTELRVGLSRLWADLSISWSSRRPRSAHSEILRLRALVPHCTHEPRLRGEFQETLYLELLDATQAIIDLRLPTGRNKELDELVFMYWYLLALSLRSQLPVPKMRGVHDARERVIAKGGEYVYVLVTGLILKELDRIARIMEELVGRVDDYEL